MDHTEVTLYAQRIAYIWELRKSFEMCIYIITRQVSELR